MLNSSVNDMAHFNRLDQLIAKLSASGKSSSEEVAMLDAPNGGSKKNATAAISIVAVKMQPATSIMEAQNFPQVRTENCFEHHTLRDSQIKVGEIEQHNMTLQLMVPSMDTIEPLPWAFEDSISDLKAQKNVQLEISDPKDQPTSDRSAQPNKEIETFPEAVAVLSAGSGINNLPRQIPSPLPVVKHCEGLDRQYWETSDFKFFYFFVMRSMLSSSLAWSSLLTCLVQ